MDKLRAIQYFNQAVENGSFAAAARVLDVSTPAVTQLVAALERSLGVVLLHRSRQGLALTTDGERYYETSRKIAAELRDVEQRIGPRGAKPGGTLTVGLRGPLGPACVMPHMAQFIAHYPGIELAFKPVVTFHEIDGKGLDVAVLAGWPPERNLIVRPLAQTQHVICAAPEYLAHAGVPQMPDALRHHHCLIHRSSGGTLLDRWIFEKDGDQRTIDVHTRFISDERNLLDEAACNGAGIIRVTDLTAQRYLRTGLLVPLLSDWQALEAPTIYAAYPPSQRRSKLVRVFVEFLVEIFAEIDRERMLMEGRKVAPVRKPNWYGRTLGRQSIYTTRNRKSVT
jgi:DNA-binding transcriptional LysR family regulator